MLNKEKHQLIMGQILKDIYTDTEISSQLGFKGGTAAYLFYNLPRFSVDLDFDWLDEDETSQELILNKIETILKKYGSVREKRLKYFTIFLLLSYGEADHNIKIEINTRKPFPEIRQFYELKDFLGIPVLVAKKEYLFAGKLTALAYRRELAMRDIYDTYFFVKSNFDINKELIEKIAEKNPKEVFSDCITRIEQSKNISPLQGLGELLDEKQKYFNKEKLRDETIFLLKNYLSVLK